MSGTSMDGIDCSLTKTNGKILQRTAINCIGNYEQKTINLLKRVMKEFDPKIFNQDLIEGLDFHVTNDHYSILKDIDKRILNKVSLIGFHGQTIYHNPIDKQSIQVGSPEMLSKLMGIPVVGNFRSNDLLYGGEGAPLSPIYHKFIIEKENLRLPSCIINIGGISNVTCWDGEKLISFDMGPGNFLIDKYMQEIFNKRYDSDGEKAFMGKASDKLRSVFLRDSFFKRKFPKTLDVRYFLDFYKIVINENLTDNDIISTLTFFTIDAILKGLKDINITFKDIIITGGGANNKFIVNKLKQKFNFLKTGKQIGLNNDFIESELIAFLAARTLFNLPSTYPSTTGVSAPTICGNVFYPTSQN
jgi:anhydro-N-acetylmuramic acid kinase